MDQTVTAAGGEAETLVQRLEGLERRLVEVLSLLGFEDEALERREGIDDLSVSAADWPAARAASLEPGPLLDLARLCHGALTLELLIGDVVALDVPAAAGPRDFERFREEAEQYGEAMTVRLRLDKSRLLDAWGVGGPHAVCKLFLRHESLARALRVPLEDLETGLFAAVDDEVKLVLLVLDRPLALDGEHLAVAGERFLAQWERFLPAAPPDPGPVRALREAAVQSLQWVSFDLDRLTPLHLLARWRKPGQLPGPPWNAAVEALYEKLLALALVYTADRTARQDGGELVCLFGAERHNAEVRVPDTPGEGADLWRPVPQEDLAEQIAVLADTALWAHDGSRGTSDRLQVVRRVVAQDLYATAPAAARRFLAGRAAALRQHAEWSWRTFMEGKLDTYFDRVERLEKVVDETAGKLDEQIRGLNKDLSDSMLAGVAAVVGSFIAAMFRPGASAKVFALGLLLYAGYLLLFPGTFGLLSTWLQFRETLNAFQGRIEGFGRRLYGETVDQITGSRIPEASRRFERWLWATLGIYLLVFLALCVAAWKADVLIP